MLLTGKIKTLTNTGMPDYTICSQATAVLSLVNLNFKLSINKAGGTAQTLVNTTDLSTVSGLTFATFTYGDYDIAFTNFNIDLSTGAFQATIEVYVSGSTNIVTWERFYVFLEISKTGYQPFRNTFEFYNYDIGNSSSITGFTDTTGNEDFNIILVDDTNNVVSGKQTKAASNFIALRRPFSNKIYFYNMIGTQGTISYSSPDGIIGSGDSGLIQQDEDLEIEQTITLSNGDSCSSDFTAAQKIWYPLIITSYTPNEATCNNCINNINENIVAHYYDATTTSVFKIDGVSYFLSEFMTTTVKKDIINYKSEISDTNSTTSTLTYALWTADSTPFLTPIEWTFTPSDLGDNIIKITTTYSFVNYLSTDSILYECYETFNIPSCNWWTVEAQEECTKYTITNCSANLMTLVVQLMDDNKVLQDVSTTTVESLESLELDLTTDGIYVLKVTDHLGRDTFYTLPVYCALQTCILSYLQTILCNPIDSKNCKVEPHYNFNSLIANAHTYFLLLNEELGNNYIYSTISADKVNELYTLKTFIDRFTEYCETPDSPCIPCNQ